MIGSDLEDANLESQLASWAASAAVRQPQLETVVGRSQQLTAT